jgi:hypothetical protein
MLREHQRGVQKVCRLEVAVSIWTLLVKVLVKV